MIMDAAGSSWRGSTAKPEQGVLENRLIKDNDVKLCIGGNDREYR